MDKLYTLIHFGIAKNTYLHLSSSKVCGRVPNVYCPQFTQKYSTCSINRGHCIFPVWKVFLATIQPPQKWGKWKYHYYHDIIVYIKSPAMSPLFLSLPYPAAQPSSTSQSTFLSHQAAQPSEHSAAQPSSSTHNVFFTINISNNIVYNIHVPSYPSFSA